MPLLKRRAVKKIKFVSFVTAILLLVALAVRQREWRVNALPASQTDALSNTGYLPAIFSSRTEPVFDMADFMVGDGRLYEVRHNSGSQARHQTQLGGGHFFHTKGNEIKAEWEELWIKGNNIWRGTDTSPGNNQYYTLYENGLAGSAWSPRYWSVGDVYERNPYVVFRRKDNCQIVASGFQRSWLRFEGYYPAYTFQGGIRLENVVELTWLLQEDGQPIESYFYAESYGLVGWGSADRGYSYINEIHGPGQRPDNKREVINCLGGLSNALRYSSELNFGPLPPGFRAK
ncbi:MAG: hypothetical protein KIS95_02610 [Anaerolineae bacterium]|uniref:hypothetical protein n=1 Tax=Promineifilum sp. TaxID=2664178 RepID=UPI001D8BBA03|nr:hypothetical protein [Anaerolineales bacterium]MCO5180255.1 hypothetical protein [Promineifilum sp.]MCW5846095.1 hypothetical protein [Anaerolineae bacterium]